MAGLFGNNQGMGILGAQQIQPWQNTLGILASALKDATNSFSGNGGDTDNLSKWSATQGQMQQRQQLIAGLSSTDPVERQKAYQTAALLGVDTKPFQQQQAAQALPQLLTAMQPRKENVEALQLDNGKSTPAFDYQVPGMGINDALTQYGNPELQTELAPKIFENLLKGPDNTPHEGLNPSTGKLGQYVMNNGVPQWLDVGVLPKAPTSRKVRIGTQEVDQEFDPITNQWREVGRGSAFKPDEGTSQPIVVQPGAQLVDRRTGKVVYTAPPKKLPASVQNAESDDIAAIQTARGLSKDLGVIRDQIDTGKLVLSPFANAAGSAMNYMGMGNDNSHRLASFKASLEKQRNDSLRLNKGVQTEGDAQRAWNELFQNLNDQKLVSERLAEIQAINDRAANLRAQQIDLRRRNFDYPDFDASQLNPNAALGGPGSTGNPNPGQRPTNVPPGTTETKVINGKTYFKINGQWHQ